MKKTISLVVVVMLIPFFMVSAEPPTALKKYFTPANITELDWILLKAQVSSFTQPIRWDEYGLVESVSLFALNKKELVGMTFLINKQRYISVSNDIAKKVFADVVLSASNILSLTIPEVKDSDNVYANFVIIGGSAIADYNQGQVRFRK